MLSSTFKTSIWHGKRQAEEKRRRKQKSDHTFTQFNHSHRSIQHWTLNTVKYELMMEMTINCK